jgi:hypothetical protein
MASVRKRYRYVGPAPIKARAAGRPAGTRISCPGDLLAWARDTGQRPGPDGLVAATFIIDTNGDLLVADRRSEHVGCAGGGPVLSAGELFFLVEGGRAVVVEASNQSTGFCPEPQSWPALAAALERIGVAHPGRFTTEVLFRRCERCGERNIVRDGWFVCGVCQADLPAEWNFAEGDYSALPGGEASGAT